MSDFQLVQQAVVQSSKSLLNKLPSIENIEQALQQELLEEENK